MTDVGAVSYSLRVEVAGTWTMLQFMKRVLLRILFTAIFASASFLPISYIVILDDSLHGFPPADWNAACLEMVIVSLGLLLPFSILFGIGECQLWLWRDLRGFGSIAMSVYPAIVACMGGIFAFLLFVDPESDRVAGRLLTLGGGLAFFLAGSLHWWLWCYLERQEDPPASQAWYALAFMLAGAFLGTMIAWTAPSPLVSSTLDYWRNAWVEMPSSPKLPVEPDRHPGDF